MKPTMFLKCRYFLQVPHFLFYFILLLNTFFLSCKKNVEYQQYFQQPKLFSQTIRQINEVVVFNNFPPVIASRNYVYACIAAYEALVPIDKKYHTMAGQIKHLPLRPSLDIQNVNYHLASLLSAIKVGNAVTFPEGVLMNEYDRLLKIADSLGMSEQEIKATTSYSDSIVLWVLKWSKKDNYLQTRSGKKFSLNMNDIAKWIPTPPTYTDALEPNWRYIRPILLDSAEMFKAPTPPVVNVKNKTGEFYKYAIEVMNVGDSLTDEQKHIADFWDDNPFKMNVIGHVMFATKKFSPPGHWLNIISLIGSQQGLLFEDLAVIYAHTSIALFDAFISCWYQKYDTKYVRPETIITKYFNTNWQPYIQTPPFPSYTSGHATISAAAAEVITHYMGDKVKYVDSSLNEWGIKPRSFLSVYDAAQEAAMSRLYGGIHYRFDNQEGNKVGSKIGKLVVEKLKLK